MTLTSFMAKYLWDNRRKAFLLLHSRRHELMKAMEQAPAIVDCIGVRYLCPSCCSVAMVLSDSSSIHLLDGPDAR